MGKVEGVNERTEFVVPEDTRLVGFSGQHLGKRGEIANVVPT
jgi:hypothetical protein